MYAECLWRPESLEGLRATVVVTLTFPFAVLKSILDGDTVLIEDDNSEAQLVSERWRPLQLWYH